MWEQTKEIIKIKNYVRLFYPSWPSIIIYFGSDDISINKNTW